MTRATEALTLIYSGGAGNTNPLLSYGGLASTAANRNVMSQSWTTVTIPGITIKYAASNALGAGYLSYTAANHSITWLTFAGASSTIAVSGSGSYAIGSTSLGFLELAIVYGSLPGSDVGQSITITDTLDTVFGSPSGNELAAGFTEYRCLYLHNRSGAAATATTIALTTNTPRSTVTIGSAFIPLSVYATTAAQQYTFRGMNWSVGRPAFTKSLSATTSRERLVVLNPNGTPRFPFFPSAGAQVSDGATVDVDLLLQDKYDSTGLLSSVQWGTGLNFGTIPAGKMVSFWLRRSLPPNPTLPASESIRLDVGTTLS